MKIVEKRKLYDFYQIIIELVKDLKLQPDENGVYRIKLKHLMGKEQYCHPMYSNLCFSFIENKGKDDVCFKVNKEYVKVFKI